MESGREKGKYIGLPEFWGIGSSAQPPYKCQYAYLVRLMMYGELVNILNNHIFFSYEA